ncbi:hypothetical protein C8R48DRAFT_782703 [Suillus tomentosus]|nr:hypothetical protein C8R48DRAFT_782703 [Suillus tomentosus]
MPAVTRSQRAAATSMKKRAAQTVRAQRINNRLRAVHGDGPFRGTRSGRHAMVAPQVAIAAVHQQEDPQPDVTDLNVQHNLVDAVQTEPTFDADHNIKQEVDSVVKQEASSVIKQETDPAVKQEMDSFIGIIKSESD